MGGLRSLFLCGFLQAELFRCSRLETRILTQHRTAHCREEHTSGSWVKGQFGPSGPGQLPFNHSRQWGLDRRSSLDRSPGSCSCVVEQDPVNLC